jgi:hypothetical protein
LAGGIGLAIKIFGRTPFNRSKDVDLYTGLDFFDALDEHYEREKEGKPVNVKDKILAKVFDSTCCSDVVERMKRCKRCEAGYLVIPTNVDSSLHWQSSHLFSSN